MEKIFNLTSTFKSHTEDDGSIMIKGMASTTDFDRAGDSISADAWTKGGLSNFENNPIILFNHDYNRPIGRATNLKSTDNGLELTAKISKAAKDVAELVKDGVLGAFSVGFRVKDADYIEETDGLRIKDAELFEVSVVSVPCNQSATFSLAKSFDSIAEYEDFKKTFTISDGTQVQKEIQMSEETQQPVDLEAFAKKVAEETAAKIAMKQAEQKAAEMAVQKDLDEQATAKAEAKAQQDEEVKTAIVSGVESGATRLVEDMQKEFEAAKAEEISALTKKYEGEVKEKAEELESMRNRKYEFSTQSKEVFTLVSVVNMDGEVLSEQTIGQDQTFTITGLAQNANYILKASHDEYGFVERSFSPNSMVHIENIEFNLSALSTIYDNNQIPKVFTVSQNFPNPFNPLTTLQYTIPDNAVVKITIFDNMGRLVKNLMDGYQIAGRNTIQWNATDNMSQPVSAGMYIYTIEANGFFASKKMILLK